MSNDILPFPMPNDIIDGKTVVASCEYRDEPSFIAVVLLLAKESPFFEVALYYQEDATDHPATKQGTILSLGTHYNIVPAVKDYQQSGGEY